MPFLATLQVKDWIIAGLASLCLLMGVLCFVSVSLPFGVTLEGWRPWGLRMERERNALIDAQKAAGKAQQTVNDAQQTKYDNAAKGSEDEKKLTDVAVRDAVAEYIRDRRVPAGGSCPSRNPDPAAESGVAGVDQGLPPIGDISISEPDLRALSEASSYAVACRAFVIEVAG